MTSQTTAKLDEAFQAFDDYNGKDPNGFSWEGRVYPRELFLSLKLHDWVKKLASNASVPLLLASRSQHIGRWEIPRDDYPRDREGYLSWRKALSLRHADKTRSILEGIGYPSHTIDRVMQIILKRKLKADQEVQIMENALCLVFLQYQYEDFLLQHPDKIVGILQKTLRKMDADGRKHALTLNYSPSGKRYLEQALSSANR